MQSLIAIMTPEGYRLGFGDNDPLGWTITAAYFGAAGLCAWAWRGELSLGRRDARHAALHRLQHRRVALAHGPMELAGVEHERPLETAQCGIFGQIAIRPVLVHAEDPRVAANRRADDLARIAELPQPGETQRLQLRPAGIAAIHAATAKFRASRRIGSVLVRVVCQITTSDPIPSTASAGSMGSPGICNWANPRLPTR